MNGIDVQDHARLGPHVYLGGSQGESTYARVTLDRDYLPDLVNAYKGRHGHYIGRVRNAWLFAFESNLRRFYRLRRSTRDDDGVIIRMTCVAQSVVGGVGSWIKLDGDDPTQYDLWGNVRDGVHSYRDELISVRGWSLLAIVAKGMPRSYWRVIEIDGELGEVVVWRLNDYRAPLMNLQAANIKRILKDRNSL